MVTLASMVKFVLLVTFISIDSTGSILSVLLASQATKVILLSPLKCRLGTNRSLLPSVLLISSAQPMLTLDGISSHVLPTRRYSQRPFCVSTPTTATPLSESISSSPISLAT